ncbi:MAG: hypothetical protein R3F61_01445 [Myxococcota bacterium]
MNLPLLLFAAAASDVPLPDRNPGSTRWVAGPHDLSMGTALWQHPTFGHSYPYFGLDQPRVNVNATYVVRVGGPAVAGVHVAYHDIAYGPDGDRRTRSTRLEPRVGFRIGRNTRTRADFSVGGAMDFGQHRTMVAPVLATTGRHWIGASRKWFVWAEARIGLWLEAGSSLQFCMEWCDQAYVNNPGGTGLLWGFGRSFGPTP